MAEGHSGNNSAAQTVSEKPVVKQSGKPFWQAFLSKEQLLRYGLFAVVLLFVLGAIGVVLGSFDFVLRNILLIAFILLVAVLLWKTDVLLKLRDYQRAVIMRLGRVNRVGGPGWTIVLPFIEEPHIVDLRTQTIDIPRQDVLIKDNIEIIIDALLFLKVKGDRQSVINSVVQVQDYRKAISAFVSAKLRDIVGGMVLVDVITSVDKINHALQEELEKFAGGWGLNIERVELQDIDLPESVLKAMHEQKAAEQEKKARIERAEAQKAEISLVNEATGTLSDKAITYYYIKALEEMSKGQSTKLVFPMEISRLAESVSSRISPKTEITGEMVEGMLKRISGKTKK